MMSTDSMVAPSLSARLVAPVLDFILLASLNFGYDWLKDNRVATVSEQNLLIVLGVAGFVHLFLSIFPGRSFGKMACDLYQVDRAGKPLSFVRRLVRAALSSTALILTFVGVGGFGLLDGSKSVQTLAPELLVLMMSCAVGVGVVNLFVVLARNDRRSLHDLVAGSYLMSKLPELGGAGSASIGAQLTISPEGEISGLPSEWVPVEKAPRLFSVNLIGTRMAGEQPIDFSGRFMVGTQTFAVVGVPFYGFRRYIYSRDGAQYQFLAEAPVSAGWKMWNPIGLFTLVLTFFGALWASFYLR